jgi:hypothetical protein
MSLTSAPSRILPYNSEEHAWSFVNYMYFLSIQPPHRPLDLQSATINQCTLRQRINGGRYHITTGGDNPMFLPLKAAASATCITLGENGKVRLFARDMFAHEVKNINQEVCPYWSILRVADAFLLSPVMHMTHTFECMTPEAQLGLRKFFNQRPALRNSQVGATFINFRK